MLNIYTSRRKLVDRDVVYNLHDFFDNTVVGAIRKKIYELTDADRMTLGKEGYITAVSEDIISTKYGEMSLSNISTKAKALISIRYMAANDMLKVLNITDIEDDFEDVLKAAECANISVLIFFKYYPFTWRNITMTARFDDKYIMPLNEYADMLNGLGEMYNREFYLSFGDDKAHFELFSNSQKITILTQNTAQKALLFNTLRNALMNRNVKALEFNSLNADGNAFDISKIIVEDKENPNAFDALEKSGQPYVVIIDGDKNVDSCGCFEYTEVPIYKFVIISEKKAFYAYSKLQETHILSDSFGEDRFEFTLQAERFDSPIIKMDFCEFEDSF